MTDTWAVYGHGSWFAGHRDSDIDVMVVTEEPLTREEAAMRVLPLLPDPVSAGTPLDVIVVRPDQLTFRLRALAAHGEHLDGDDVVGAMPPVRPFAWAVSMRAEIAERQAAGEPIALTAIRAALAGEGRMVVRKADVVAAAAGGRWEELARAAWARRLEPTFDHPDLAAAVEAAYWSPAGDAGLPDWEERGLAHRGNRSALLTVYRNVLTPGEIERLAAVPAESAQLGGWRKAPLVDDDDDLAGALGDLVALANFFWWRYDLAHWEAIEVHRHGPGSTFPGHIDRAPAYPTRAFNVVAMVRPAALGGDLYLNLGGDSQLHPRLAPGDVSIFGSQLVHGVTKVEEGERVVVVSHVHDKPK